VEEAAALWNYLMKNPDCSTIASTFAQAMAPPTVFPPIPPPDHDATINADPGALPLPPSQVEPTAPPPAPPTPEPEQDITKLQSTLDTLLSLDKAFQPQGIIKKVQHKIKSLQPPTPQPQTPKQIFTVHVAAMAELHDAILKAAQAVDNIPNDIDAFTAAHSKRHDEHAARIEGYENKILEYQTLIGTAKEQYHTLQAQIKTLHDDAMAQRQQTKLDADAAMLSYTQALPIGTLALSQPAQLDLHAQLQRSSLPEQIAHFSKLCDSQDFLTALTTHCATGDLLQPTPGEPPLRLGDLFKGAIQSMNLACQQEQQQIVQLSQRTAAAAEAERTTAEQAAIASAVARHEAEMTAHYTDLQVAPVQQDTEPNMDPTPAEDIDEDMPLAATPPSPSAAPLPNKKQRRAINKDAAAASAKASTTTAIPVIAKAKNLRTTKATAYATSDA
jgi:hypothetical protein